MSRQSMSSWFVAGAVAVFAMVVAADDKVGKTDTGTKEPTAKAPASKGLGEPTSLTRLSPDYDIWIDTKRKLVVVDGKVVLRDGLLEMFACPKGTKEHEAIVAVNCNAQFVHAGLIAVGAEPGHPVVFAPDYKPATGPVVDVTVLWKDENGANQQIRAQEWLKHTKTGKPMEYSWVFAGSEVATDPTTGKKYYLADGGDFICVSNFSSAMLDLPIASSQSNADLAFRAFTEKIPPVGTPVRLVLEPRLDKAQPKEKPSQKKPEKPEKKPGANPAKDKPKPASGGR